MKLLYTKDEYGKKILLDEYNHQIMMEWEKSYMEECVNFLDPSGSILEIGFGLAYSAREICKNKNVKKYSLIECSPIVWKKFEEFSHEIKQERPDLELILIKGRWQDVLTTTEIYDSVFFDDYMGLNFQEDISRFNKFLFEILLYHSKIGTRISYYSTSDKIIETNTIKSTSKPYYVEIPNHCKYAKGKIMYIPLIEKIAEPIKDNLKDDLLKEAISYRNLTNKLNTYTNINKSEPKSPCVNYLIIDDFYSNPLETREYALTQDFTLVGNFPGKRSIALANESIKNLIEKYIEPYAGKIIDFPIEKSDTNFNGSYEYTNSYDKSFIQYGINENICNNWLGILYMTPNANSISGTDFYIPIYNMFYMNNKEKSNNKEKIQENLYTHDITKWKRTESISNKFNRLLLFRANQYYSCVNYFGNDNINGSLIQLFFFTSER
jgi:hypothetical protein